MGDNNPEGEEQQPSPTDSVQPQMTVHPVSYSGMPMHMYPFSHSVMPSTPPRTKRRQVKNACTNCQKACKKCDDARPCLRCVKYGISEECVDSQRKERQKGVKRGPYKKRDGKTNNANDQQVDVSVQPGMMVPPAVAATSATPPIPYMSPYTPFYGQYPATHVPKAGEAPVYVPQLFYAPIAPPQAMPAGHGSGQDGEPAPYTPYYPVFTAPYHQAYAAPYMVPAPRPEGQMPMAPGPVAHPAHAHPPHPAHHHPHYAPYPPQAYPKPPSRGPEINAHHMMDARRDARLDMSRMPEGMHGHHGKAG
ncbi:hypothetical protein WOLCODRAFT_136160 [Wolfiporia cocos MD-104 SS10]|uniref:Transcription activator of gluconeogenesis ERT1 n=1 Tax=Wolfiporia cocos (strain MD-104) TaxID=742152 RepID=A0A2H3JHS2_WOLCO|nr:hypothetical protein WOLCODRAFT_136160 [Wolfiporia cocos MD-104 SS10]